VLDKKQALATMDVHIIRAEAEHRRRLERRTSRFTTLYPSLRRAPVEAREDLLDEAGRSALRSWPTYALGLVTVAALIVPFYAPVRAISHLKATELASAMLILVSILGITLYLRIRSHLKHLVAVRYENTHGSQELSGGAT
jgi:hypothetical protein